jgi:meso-butanediol dehydrogenase / (S,S)-butanediol dehydrogenase / diacetyl reductase
MKRLDGKRVLLTGTAGGQGEAAQEWFAREGARIVGCDIQPGRAEATAAALREQGHDVVGVTVDLSDHEAAKAWVEDGAERLGGIDVLYNNAAGYAFEPFAEMSLETWSRSIHTELDIIFYTTRPAWQYLADGGGSIINTASISGIRGMPTQAAHSAAKGGVIGFTIGLAAEGGGVGIRANSISPGFVDSPATRDAVNAELREWMVSRHLIQRPGTGTDIAGCAVYLASDESSWVTGQNFSVDGGWSAGFR